MLLLRYEVAVEDADAHLLRIDVTVTAGDAPLPPEITLFLPVWAPGSYLVRDYARHVERLSATAGGVTVAAKKVRKNAWRACTNEARELRVSYSLFAHELSVRTNHVDRTHAALCGAATWLLPEAPITSIRVRTRMPDGWSVATSLEDGEEPWTYRAASVDELVDAPFECGPMKPRTFQALGKEHRLWVVENAHAAVVDGARLAREMRGIVETAAALVGDRELPYDRYDFFWHVSPRGRGGLEHANSASIQVPPAAFATRAGHLDVLSLVAHEHLHAWNVKRIRPAGLVPLRYDGEQHTRLLWWFEGATSYFDWRILLRAGFATPREYVDHLTSTLRLHENAPGAAIQSLEDASFDAWIKAYRPDEDQPNAAVSYYVKGELVALQCDLAIRKQTSGAKSLDDVLRHLWREFGKTNVPVPEDGMADIVEEATGVSLRGELAAMVSGAAHVDPTAGLGAFGLALDRKSRAPRVVRSSLGAKIRRADRRAFVENVYRGGAAMRAGLEAGDEILAVDGRRIEDGAVDALFGVLAAGARVPVLFVRDGLVEARHVVLDQPRPIAATITVRPDATAAELSLLEGWLGDGAADQLRATP